ncbi:hypothetical protein [Kribbella sp. NPDC006257]|uniref:hypothetical protein n=1 Tax=Kribbella sp. NPDC006257 TaxID=3156738 RepID=UPI0033B0789A
MPRWIRRTFALLFAVLITVAGAALPASAGGPTSVLLSAPPKVVAFGYEDARYIRLQELTGIDVNSHPAGERDAHTEGPFVRALWLIHDMAIWRFDLIYPNAPGGPWIATYESVDGLASLPAKPIWHRSKDPAALTRLLSSLKLVGGEFTGGPVGPPDLAQPSAVPEPAPATETSAAQDPATQAPAGQTIETRPAALSGWRWIIPGVVLGAVASYLALRYVPRRRPWELTDVE